MLRSLTLIPTRRRLCTTWKRWLEHSSSTMAADLVKDRLSAASTWSLVAEFWAWMVAAFEGTTTQSSTDMLRFEAVVEPRCCTKRS